MQRLVRLAIRVKPTADRRRFLRATFAPLCDRTTDRDGPRPPNEAPREAVDYEEIEEYFDERPAPHMQDEDAAERFRRSVPIPLTHGARGVFEVEDLVSLLRHEGVADLCAIRVPKEKRYTDFLVIGSCRTQRQAEGVADIVRRVFKLKKRPDEPVPAVDGKKTKRAKPADWLAMDLGNIVLHLFLPEVRDFYDLETLWACGEAFDSHSIQPARTASLPAGFDVEALLKEFQAKDAEKESP